MFQKTEHPYNLRNDHLFRTYNVKAVQGRTELKHCHSWDLRYDFLFLLIFKKSGNVRVIKQAIRYWKPDNCPCRLWKTYIKGLRYLLSCSISIWFGFEQITSP